MALTLQATTDFAQTAYDLRAWYALRPELYFDQAADVGSTDESIRGKIVTFTILNELAIQSTALTDGTDVTPIAMGDSQVSITLTEYGAAIVTSAKMRGTTFIDIDPVVSNLIGFNAGISVNDVARAALDAGTNVMYGSGLGATALGAVTARSAVVAGTTIGTIDIRSARARLASMNAQRFGNLYNAFVHPDLVSDLMGETIGSSQIQGWTAAQVYSDPSNILNGEIGSYQGFRWIETPTAPVYQGAGSASAVNVYGTFLMGRQALAKAYSKAPGFGPYPHVFPGPVTDYLRRLQPTSWYWLGQYGVFRNPALIRIESASILGGDISTTFGTATTYEPAVDLGELVGPPIV